MSVEAIYIFFFSFGYLALVSRSAFVLVKFLASSVFLLILCASVTLMTFLIFNPLTLFLPQGLCTSCLSAWSFASSSSDGQGFYIQISIQMALGC